MAISPSHQLQQLSPALVWTHFLELTGIPRPSGEEDAACQHILSWARECRFTTSTDSAGNVVVRVPASQGRENGPTLILQSHLDMVCEREPDSPFDPRIGSIDVDFDEDFVFARGTTLGADNGIGVAISMALANDPAVGHGPLELLFTVGEEWGLAGAKAFDQSLLSGQILLNLDGMKDDTITIGCAGSVDVLLTIDLDPKPTLDTDTTLELTIAGLQGGHSGLDINEHRGNAIQLLAQILRPLVQPTNIRLVRLDGGVSRNAIPRDARALISVPAGTEDALRERVLGETATIRRRGKAHSDGLTISIESITPRAFNASGVKTTRTVLDLIAALPSGPITIDQTHQTVETSSSLNIAATHGEARLTLTLMVRSANEASLADVVSTLSVAGHLADAEVEIRHGYPPWRTSRESPLVAAATATHRRVFGAAPRIEVAHCGLECAVLSTKLPGCEMIAVGPDIIGAHAPGERLRVSSTARSYHFLGELLNDLSG